MFTTNLIFSLHWFLQFAAVHVICFYFLPVTSSLLRNYKNRINDTWDAKLVLPEYSQNHRLS